MKIWRIEEVDIWRFGIWRSGHLKMWGFEEVDIWRSEHL